MSGHEPKTRKEHFRMAQALVQMAGTDDQAKESDRALLVHMAQVHATLALAGPTRPNDHRIQAGVGAHVYLSTACLHGQHGYCQATVGAVGRKVPGTCKFCAAPCVCDCHGDCDEGSQPDDRADRRTT